MIPATSTLDSSPSLPTLAAIQRRRRELLAFQAGQRTAPATAPPGDPFDGEESSFEEDACLVQEPAPPSQAIRPSTFWVPVQKTKAPDAGGLMRIVRLKRTLPPDAGGLNAHSALKAHTSPRCGGLNAHSALKAHTSPRCGGLNAHKALKAHTSPRPLSPTRRHSRLYGSPARMVGSPRHVQISFSGR
jgi:hypothetical protein